MLKANGVGRRIGAGGKRHALDLIEPLLIVEQRNRRMAAVLASDAQLAAVNPADAMGDEDEVLEEYRRVRDEIKEQFLALYHKIR